MKRILLFVLILAAFLFAGCIGKVVLVGIDPETDGADSPITITTGPLSTVSGDTTNSQKDFAKLPLDALQQLAGNYLNNNLAVPQDILDAIKNKPGADVIKPDPDNPDIVDPDKPVVNTKLPLKVMAYKHISIDQVMHMRYVVEGVCGPDLGGSFKITFSDDREIYVYKSKEDVNTTEGRGYRPGCDYTSHKDVAWMEVYSDPGEDAEYITVTAL